MEVVNLHGLTCGQTEFSCCLVTDDIFTLTSGKQKKFTMTIVFRETVEITDPFSLIYYRRNEDVARLCDDFVRDNAKNMWEKSDTDAPLSTRSVQGRLERRTTGLNYIQLHFIRTESTMNSQRPIIGFGWTDILKPKSRKRETPDEFRFLQMHPSSDMGLFLVLPFDAEKVWVLSDKSFGSYQSLSDIYSVMPTFMECYVCNDRRPNRAFVMFNCLHAVCGECSNNMSTSASLGRCGKCSKEIKSKERIKTRHGLCPIDLCVDNKENTGVVLKPCRCFVYCKSLVMAVRKHQTNQSAVLRDIRYCPYEACKLRIERFEILFNDVYGSID